MRPFKGLMFQFRNNYYTKLVTVFFGIITVSLLFLMFIFSWHQNEINAREKLDFDTNSFSRFTQILEKKVLSDVNGIMYNGVFEILPYNDLSDYNAANPFIYSNNPFDTTLNYQKRLYQLQQNYPYITSIDIYSYKFDTYISSSGSVFFNALKRKDDLASMVPYHILSNPKVANSFGIWFSPAQNHVFAPYAGITSFVQRLPLFSSPSSSDVVIIINIDPTVLYNDYFKDQLLYNSYFYIIDQDNNVILKTSTENYLFDVMNKDKLSDKIKKNLTGKDKFTYEKAEYNIIWQASSVNSWKYIYVSQKPSTLAQLALSLRYVFTWFVAIFITCLVITLFASKKIYMPIDALLKYTNSILRSSTNEKKGDIEEITNAFTSINNELMYYKDNIDKNSPLLLNNIAINLLDGSVKDLDELNSWLSILTMRFEHKSFFCFIVRIDPEVYESLDNQKRDFFLLYIRQQMEDYYKHKNTDTLKFISCYRRDGIIPFIINIDEEHYSKEKEAAFSILSNMSDEISKVISIAISDPITDLSQLNSIYKVTLTYFKYVFVYGNGNVFDMERVNRLNNSTCAYDTSSKSNLKTLLKLGKFAELKIDIAKFYNDAKSKNYSYTYLQNFSSEIISMIVHEAENNNLSIPHFQDGDLNASFSKLTSIDKCAEWYESIINIYAGAMQAKLLNMDSKYMKDILKYIDENIIDITLNSVADKFKTSTAHFSRMFKKQTGTNFSDYVIEKRLEHACQLIVTTDMKISDIASTLGYLNINYFNKIFKLKYNATPMQYRKQNRMSDESAPS